MTKTRITISIIVLFVVCAIALTGGFLPSAVAYAANDLNIDSTNVLDDLTGSTIGGKEFDIADYPYDEKGKTQVISFSEYCYSYYSNKQGNFGLYVYVYNPNGIAFDESTGRNKIQFSADGGKTYDKYTLQFLNYSHGADCEGLFYKFKVVFTDAQRKAVLNALDSEKRVYKISGIELSSGGGNVVEYVVAQTYEYTGFAEGYGAFEGSADSLTCKVDGLSVYLTLDVHSTYYRPGGTNGGAYAQDTLHSVYFSVPNSLIEEYGEMTAVHATWLNARTSPIFVTGDEAVYKAVKSYLGQYVDGGNYHLLSDANKNNDLAYALIASKFIESADWNDAAYGSSWLSYNANRKYTKSDVDLYTLAYCFLAENGDADNYTLPAEALLGDKNEGIKGWFEEYTSEHGGELVNDRFSSELFSEVADSFTDVTITANDTFKLTDEQISQDWWQQFVGGGYNVTGTTEYLISAIKQVGADDFKSTVYDTCEGLYIDESDYEEFKAFYDEATEKEETVYLFRYAQTEYVSHEVAVYTKGDDGAIFKGFDYDYVSTNAYFAEMWVQLDFDIIDVTMTKNGVDTVIPVVMSPVDLAADATPPVITNEDGPDWLLIILAVLLLILLLVLLWPFLPYVIKFVIWLISLPFKAIASLVKAVRKCKADKPKKGRKGSKGTTMPHIEGEVSGESKQTESVPKYRRKRGA